MQHVSVAAPKPRALSCLIALSSMLALSSCNPAYQKPASPENTASVRFTTPQEKGWSSAMNAYVHDGSDKCGTPKKIFSMGGGMFNFGGGKKADGDIGMPKDPATTYVPGRYYETRVPVDKRFDFTVAGGERDGQCFLSGSFQPEANALYEVTYKTDRFKCYVRVDRLVADNGAVSRSRETTAHMRSRPCTAFWN
ncbi:hypothetical protein LF41_1318 [Lysobacter dokdonensis DS-58]|uniref:Secreted protein n=1 Tax=Lysobacter dokdonensis DS-58 TaxID=1300345 RepID=A0A0A2WLT8_9GAMM|nr:hypothetical protein [Lysobacter dokdonensis]KGQ20778.1 hypothetical protein LF41_1318 [Lysobacter dokdonensis DS-58]